MNGKKILSIVVIFLLLLSMYPIAMLAEDNYVPGYTSCDNGDHLYSIKIQTGANPNQNAAWKEFYFSTMADAIKAADEGFNCNGSTYSGKEDASNAIVKRFFEQNKPYSIVVNSEKAGDNVTISENITIDKEVHFILAKNTSNNGQATPQTISFAGKITIKNGGALIQEQGGSRSSATVTLSNPIVVENGGSLLLRRTGTNDSKETTWQAPAGNSVIQVEQGGTATLTDLCVGDNANSDTPAITTAGTLNIVPYTNQDAKISFIQVAQGGSLQMNDTDNGTTSVEKISIAQDGKAVLNQGSITTLELVDGATATIDDAVVTKVSLNSGANVTLGENFAQTVTTFSLPAGSSVTVNGATYTAKNQSGTVTATGLVKLPGGGEAHNGEKSITLPANTLVYGDVIASGKTQMPSVDADGEVIIPSNGGSVINKESGKTTEMPYGGSVSASGEDGVTVTVNVNGVTLDRSSASLYWNIDNNTVQLTATVDPSSAPVTWSSDNGDVATVNENGVVTAHKDGTAIITATAGNKIASCTVTVSTYHYTGKYSYEISVAQPDNGSVAVDKYATEGETVTITATPDDGYMLDTLSVTAGGKELEVTDNGDGTYSFTMPSSKVSITAAFAEDPDWVEPEQPEEPSTTVADIFSDVTPDAWYTDAVQYAYDNGLMTGTSTTTFEPNTTTTRGMIVSMLHRLEGSPAVGIADFSDVAGGDWYADPVAWAASEGIVGGYGDGTFGPNDPITREQMASILYRYADYKGLDVSARASLDAYSDADSVSPWASDVMSWAVSEGIISGMTEDTLAPQGTATRAQVAAMFQRFLENVMA